jgi:hypothetical protein
MIPHLAYDCHGSVVDILPERLLLVDGGAAAGAGEVRVSGRRRCPAGDPRDRVTCCPRRAGDAHRGVEAIRSGEGAIRG